MTWRQNDTADSTIWWESETPCLFSATVATNQGRRFLVVERLPDDGGWDWVTWSQDRQNHTLHGKAVTARLAMRAAARAARVRRVGSVHFLPSRVAADLHF